MAFLRIVPNDVNINFIGLRFFAFLISAVVIIATTVSLATRGLNYGIDFEGGYIFEVRLKEEPNVPELREKLGALNLGDTAIQKFGSDNDILIRVERKVMEGVDENIAQQKVVDAVKGVIGEDEDYRRIETIGPKVGEELVHNSMKAVLFALAAMLIYIAIRFEWQFAVCGIIALVHDTVGILALFTIFSFEFNETAIIAILITAGYSINDTIVIFDRIRENIRKYKKMDLATLVNKSLNETLSRTVLTGMTTLTSLLALYIWGGSVISSFSLPIMIGIIVGAFSSIFLASPLLLYLNVKRGETVSGVPANNN